MHIANSPENKNYPLTTNLIHILSKEVAEKTEGIIHTTPGFG